MTEFEKRDHGMKLEAIEFKMQSQSLFFRRPIGEGCKMKTSVFLDIFPHYNNIGSHHLS